MTLEELIEKYGRSSIEVKRYRAREYYRKSPDRYKDAVKKYRSTEQGRAKTNEAARKRYHAKKNKGILPSE